MSDRPSPLAGKTAVVTGASGGIGGALADALAARGGRLLLSGRSRQRLEAQAEACRQAGAAEVVSHAGDLAEEAELRRLAELVGQRLEGADLLLHSIGAFDLGPVASAPVESLDHLLRVNLRVPYLLTQLLLPSLAERQGQIVFVNSTAGLRGHGGFGPYAASKAALKALADSLRDEVNGDGVRVLSAYPGRTASAMQEKVRRLEEGPYEPEKLLQPADVAAAVVAALELPRSAELTELTIRPMQP